MKLFNLPLTKQHALSASALKTRRENRVKPVQLTGGFAVTLSSGPGVTGSVTKDRLEPFESQKPWKCQWKRASQKSPNVLTGFRCLRLVQAAFSCRVQTLGVQEEVAEVAAQRVVCRHQAERAAVAAHLSGRHTGVQRSTPGRGGGGRGQTQR